jgi:hypothetical protein
LHAISKILKIIGGIDIMCQDGNLRQKMLDFLYWFLNDEICAFHGKPK